LQTTLNFLLLGTDKRHAKDKLWRTDSIMVVALDRTNKRIAAVSIPRDTQVDVPNFGKRRINTVDYLGEVNKYPGGGPALLGRTLEENFGIPIHRWVRMDPAGFVHIVDALGGVDIHLDCPLHELVPSASDLEKLESFDLPAGDHHLDGATAERFIRFRYVSGDWGRARRQQQLLVALRQRALQLNILPKLPELWRAWRDTFTTDITLKEVLELAPLALQIRADDLHGIVIGPNLTKPGRHSLLVPQYDKIEKALDRIFETKPVRPGDSENSRRCPPTPTPTATPGRS